MWLPVAGEDDRPTERALSVGSQSLTRGPGGFAAFHVLAA
jgi:hypothetical protein